MLPSRYSTPRSPLTSSNHSAAASLYLGGPASHRASSALRPPVLLSWLGLGVRVRVRVRVGVRVRAGIRVGVRVRARVRVRVSRALMLR